MYSQIPCYYNKTLNHHINWLFSFCQLLLLHSFTFATFKLSYSKYRQAIRTSFLIINLESLDIRTKLKALNANKLLKNLIFDNEMCQTTSVFYFYRTKWSLHYSKIIWPGQVSWTLLSSPSRTRGRLTVIQYLWVIKSCWWYLLAIKQSFKYTHNIDQP